MELPVWDSGLLLSFCHVRNDKVCCSHHSLLINRYSLLLNSLYLRCQALFLQWQRAGLEYPRKTKHFVHALECSVTLLLSGSCNRDSFGTWTNIIIECKWRWCFETKVGKCLWKRFHVSSFCGAFQCIRTSAELLFFKSAGIGWFRSCNNATTFCGALQKHQQSCQECEEYDNRQVPNSVQQLAMPCASVTRKHLKLLWLKLIWRDCGC